MKVLDFSDSSGPIPFESSTLVYLAFDDTLKAKRQSLIAIPDTEYVLWPNSHWSKKLYIYTEDEMKTVDNLPWWETKPELQSP